MCAIFSDDCKIAGSDSVFMYFLILEGDGCLDLGYKSFMQGVYGDNVIFTNGKFYHMPCSEIYVEH